MIWLYILIAIVGIIGIIYILEKSNGKTNAKVSDIFNTNEFQTDLARAKEIKSFFEDIAHDKDGILSICKYDIDHPDKIDFEYEKRNPLIYFRLRLRYGYSDYLDESQNLPLPYRDEWMNKQLIMVFGKSIKDIENFGLSPHDMLYDIQRGDDNCEAVLYYKFYCPCGLKGDDRDMFINKIQGNTSS